jgi:cell division protein FtsI/penicillin-binding protein 2/cell division protein FtsW (lipid II flippase)
MKTKRNIELALLLAALPVLILLFATAIINSNGPRTLGSFAVPLSLFGGFLVSHLAVRRFAPEADPALLPITFLLSGIGICFVMRLAPDLAQRQIAWLALSIAAMIVVLVLVRSLERLAHYKWTIMLVCLVLLLLPAIVGTEISGSKIWLSFGGFSFQPGEIAKVLLVLFLSAYLAENRELLSLPTRKVLRLNIPEPATMFPLLIMWVISLLIVVFERDLGSALLFFGIFLFMIYICTGRFFYVLIGLALIGIGFVGAYFAFGHVQARVQTWLRPFDFANDKGYQLVQAIYSMADGGLFGVGVGRGMPTKIPVVASDFIFAAIAEEMGLLGAAGVLLLFMLFTIRGFLTAARAKSDIAAFTATGLTTAISFQAFVIIGGVTRLIPLTGLTLPFMSQGGSSLLASFIILGLLLRAGDEGTGVETDLKAVPLPGDNGVLGRVALGRRLTQTLTAFTLLFALLIANMTYIQVIKARSYQQMPTNNHTLAKNQMNQRGTVYTADKVVLARSTLGDDGRTYERSYPQGTLAAHLIGYTSQRYGLAGLEATQNETLTGNRNFATWQDAISSLAGAPTVGNDIILTIDSTVQEAAEDVLQGEKGAVVVMNPETGAVLAMASSPTYNPNELADLFENSSASDALFNRATQALYAPGSTFKMVTLATALETGTATPDSVYESPGSMDIGGAPVTNFAETNHGAITLAQATRVSSNTVFAQVAVQVGSKALVNYAEAFGLNNDIGRDFSVTKSLMPNPNEMTEWETAWSGVGQPVGEHQSPAGPQVTAMQMAMVGSTIGNEGIAMNPYVVQRTVSADGATVSTASPQAFNRVISKDTAKTELEILQGVVESGSGSGAAIAGISVAGKTGTAQTGKPDDDSWFVGIAPAEDPKVVVAVVIEESGSGGDAAAPKARSVLIATLKSQGLM